MIEVELDFDKTEEDHSWDYILEPAELFTARCNVVVAHEVEIQGNLINKKLSVRVLNPFSTSAKIMKHEVIGHLEGDKVLTNLTDLGNQRKLPEWLDKNCQANKRLKILMVQKTNLFYSFETFV